MDVLSHGLLPCGILTYLKRPRAERWAAAVGGIGPDIDTLWAWTSGLDDQLYPLTHRGFSHTFWGAPLLALFSWWFLTRPWMRRRFPRLTDFRVTRGVLPALVFGAWMHIALDNLTITGTPSLWPFTTERYTLGLFFYSVNTMLLASIVTFWRAWRRPNAERTIRIGTAVVIALMSLSGGFRAVTYPWDAPEQAKVTPGFVDWQWTVSQRNDTGVTVYGTNLGTQRDRIHFPEPNRTAAADAIAACQERPAYTAWRWNLWGIAVANASRREDKGWNLTFSDSAQLHATIAPPFSIFRVLRDRDDYEGLRCEVWGDGSVHIGLRPGFWGAG